MNYQQTLDYLFKQLPMYQRQGNAAYKSDLNNTLELCEILNHPETKFKSVHIAGTNGKGSTAHLIASVLQEAGYKVGLYTSPHLKDFRERIRINGKMISERDVVHFVQKYQFVFEKIALSFFEWSVGLAFTYFSDQQVDIAVVEVGMGGRLDSTNILLPEVAVITNIGLDHTQFLGNTLAKIAEEKAGVIKKNIPIVIGETQQETKAVFLKKAQKIGASIFFADQIDFKEYEIELKGNYQQKNVKTVLATLQQLQLQGWELEEKTVVLGLKNVIKNTGILGRWQILQNSNPKIICDTGHNESGLIDVTHQLQQENYHRLFFIYGTVNDKSLTKVFSILPRDAYYFFCEPNIPRAMAVDELYTYAKQVGLQGESIKEVRQALSKAKQKATQNDLIFIGGSNFVVAEVL